MDTRPETTMIYAPPELAKHRAALERLRRTDGNGSRVPTGGLVPTDQHLSCATRSTRRLG